MKIMQDMLLKFKNKLLKERISVGLDIGTSVIKTIKLKFLKDVIQLHSFYLEPIQGDISAALKTIVRTQDLSRVNISVSGPAVTLRYVDFPRMKEEELKKALKYEAQKYIPFSNSEVNVDAYILKQNLTDSNMLVLLAAVKKDFLNQRLKLINDLGITTNVVEIDSIALINTFNFNYAQEASLKNKAIALLNIGASSSNLNILEDGIPRMTRDIQIAGNNFTQKISESLGINLKSAEELKISSDNSRLNELIAALEPTISNLASEIRVSFDYYESQSASSVAKIFLSGGGSLVSGLKDRLASLLGIELEYRNPLQKINIPDSLDSQKIKSLSSQFTVALGLALRK
jgi:type IV pilus assembly protein PilM